jgi:hypothetical protein
MLVVNPACLAQTITAAALGHHPNIAKCACWCEALCDFVCCRCWLPACFKQLLAALRSLAEML